MAARPASDGTQYGPESTGGNELNKRCEPTPLRVGSQRHDTLMSHEYYQCLFYTPPLRRSNSGPDAYRTFRHFCSRWKPGWTISMPNQIPLPIVSANTFAQYCPPVAAARRECTR